MVDAVGSILVNKCTLCLSNLYSFKAHLCKACLIIICESCAFQHKRVKQTSLHTVYPLYSTGSSSCGIHKKKIEYFCKSSGCQLEICSKCLSVNHSRHDVQSIDSQKKYFKNEISRYLKINSENVQKLNLLISGITNSKEEYYKRLECVEESLFAQRDKIYEIVECVLTTIQSKIVNEKSDAENNFQKNIEPLLSLKEKSLKFNSISSVDLKTMSFDEIRECYNNVKSIVSVPDFETTLDAIELRHIVSEKVDKNDTQACIETWLGKIEVDSKLPVHNPHLIETFSKNCDFVVDMLYDSEKERWFALESYSDALYLSEFNGDFYRSFDIDFDCSYNDWYAFNCLAQLPCGRVLALLYSTYRDFKTLAVFSKSFRSFKKCSLPFLNLRKLELICSSESRNFLFLYLRNHSVFRYDVAQDEYSEAGIPLPNVARFMHISENLDTMAFSVENRVVLFSFEKNQILHSFKNHFGNYYYGVCFLSNRILLASSEECMHMLDVHDRKLHREIKRFRGRNSNVAIRDPVSIAKLPNLAFIVHCNDREEYYHGEW